MEAHRILYLFRSSVCNPVLDRVRRLEYLERILDSTIRWRSCFLRNQLPMRSPSPLRFPIWTFSGTPKELQINLTVRDNGMQGTFPSLPYNIIHKLNQKQSNWKFMVSWFLTKWTWKVDRNCAPKRGNFPSKSTPFVAGASFSSFRYRITRLKRSRVGCERGFCEMRRGGKAARRPVVEEVAIAQQPKNMSCEAIAQTPSHSGEHFTIVISN